MRHEKEPPLHLAPFPAPAPPVREGGGDLESLFRDQARHVYRIAHRITGNPSDAKDVLQTVFLRLVRRQTSLPELTAGRDAYFRRAAINGALDLVRGRATHTEELHEDGPAAHADPSLNASEREDARELKRALRHAIAALSPKAAELFVLRYIEGYDNREIARMTGTSPAVVAVLLFRTRNRLKNELKAFVSKGARS